jgi:hypothetical protein
VNNEKHCGHLVAFDYSGVHPNQPPLIRLAVAAIAAGIVGFGQEGTVAPFSGAVAAFSDAASGILRALCHPAATAAELDCSSTLKKCLTRSIASSFKWSLTQSGLIERRLHVAGQKLLRSIAGWRSFRRGPAMATCRRATRRENQTYIACG